MADFRRIVGRSEKNNSRPMTTTSRFSRNLYENIGNYITTKKKPMTLIMAKISKTDFWTDIISQKNNDTIWGVHQNLEVFFCPT